MFSIGAFLQCLAVCLGTTSLGQLSVIVPALLAMPGRVTMLGISRWTDEGGSYRTVQRFFTAPINWGKLHWCFIRHNLWDAEATYILAGDEVVVTKAGKHTYGLWIRSLLFLALQKTRSRSVLFQLLPDQYEDADGLSGAVGTGCA